MSIEEFLMSSIAGAIGEIHAWHYVGVGWKFVCLHITAGGGYVVRLWLRKGQG